MRVLIAGGGIGGLTLALMLHERGIDCIVNEAASDVKPVGVGINLLPHAIGQLDALGLSKDLDAIAIRTSRLTYMNHLGQEIWSEKRGIDAGHPVPQYSIHRGHLHTLLWRTAVERLGANAVRSDRRLQRFEQDRDGVEAFFSQDNGTDLSESGDILVGADGIHSRMRALLHPDDGGIRWRGTMMWRGAMEWPAFGDGRSMVIAGDDVAKFVLYPIAPGRKPDTRLTNWVVYARVAERDALPPARESWSRLGRFEDFKHLADRIRLPFIDVESIIRQSEAIFVYPMCDRDPLPWWTRGRVTLLGDAAHPMYPVGSNGGSQATLDARCLTDHLTVMPAEDALLAYDEDRRSATTQVVHSNREGGPEQVIDLVGMRAPGGFTDLHDVASAEELKGIASGYAKLAGFAVAARS